MKVNIVIFNQALRINDNIALHKAAQEHLPIIGLFCFDPQIFKNTPFEHINRCDKIRFDYITASLSCLNNKLQAFHIPLIVSDLPMLEVIKKLPVEIECIFAEEAIASQEKNILKAIRNSGFRVETYSSNGLLDEESLPFEIEQIPDTFTQFRKIIEKRFEIRNTFRPNLKKQDPLPFDFSDLNTVSLQSQNDAGEDAAMDRLQYYFFDSKKVSTYKETRNGLLGTDYATRFSPFLAQGCISAVTIYKLLKQYEEEVESNPSTYWVFFELLWREYFRWIHLKFGDRIFKKTGLKNESYQGYANLSQFERWCSGETGIPFIDANMRELNTTGFMSNRGRQNVASFLCKDLGIDWRWGAAYFESKLIDYDVSSNWGNWCYVAGVGNDPRENRWFNVQKQAHDYDAKAVYIKHMIPELAHLSAEEAISPWKTNAGRKAYISPMMVHEKWF